MLVLYAFDSEYAFSEKNINKFQEEYGLPGFELNETSSSNYSNSESKTIQGLVLNHGDFTQTDLTTGTQKQYKSVDIQLVNIN